MESSPYLPKRNEIESLIALFNSAHYAELEIRTQLLLKRYPESGFSWKILGTALGIQGKNAVPALQKAARFLPNDSEVYYNLGLALQAQGRFEEAIASYRRALTLKPNDADAHNDLGNALQELGQHAAAAFSYHQALALNPHHAETHNNLGFTLQEIGQLQDALASYRQALVLEPGYAVAHNNLGNVLQELGQLTAAVASFQHALALKADYAEAHYNLGNALKELGQFDAALTRYKHALESNPDLSRVRCNILFTLNFSAAYAQSYHLEEARAYGRRVAQTAERFAAWRCTTDPQRLRIGLVSGDLRNHPVAFFLESLLEQLDASQIELIAYPSAQKTDAITTRLLPYFAGWKPIHHKSDAEAAHMIHADGVHILLDLSGHTAHNRLPLFAWKAAPVQATWLGYFATTGVAEIDYLLADKVGVPEHQRAHFTESVWYLPDTRLCFSAPQFELPVTTLPALTRGYITFGSFQNLSKLNDSVLMVWSKILVALPGVCLRVANKQLGDPEVAAQFAQRLQQHGIDPVRVTLQGAVSREAYLARHTAIDIILDTFPYPGGTTTCEALWMGVPTLTLAGETLLTRQGASLLTAAGLSDWVATSEAEYIEKAIHLTGDLPKLATLRAGLRRQVLVSPVFDASRFARNFEKALWAMWHQYQGLEIQKIEPM